MTEYAPAAIRSLYDQIAAVYTSAQFAGIIGDRNHTYGYHRGGNYVSGGDYSMQYPQDYNGDGEAASALDITCANAGEHYALSQALLNTVGNPAMQAIREFYGSTDGWNVCGWDFTGGYPVSSDDSHLWHVHISVHRVYANDQSAMSNVAAAITGGGGQAPTPPPSGDRVQIDTYVVQSGDTLTTICWQYPQTDVVPASVAADNGFGVNDPIHVGQPLKILSAQGPGGGGGGGGSPHRGRPWPSYMPQNEYFGDINGPNASHGGYYASEQPDVKAIQEQLLWKNYVPGLQYPSGWADGLFEQETVDAVTRFQQAEMPGTQFYGQVWSDDWAQLFGS